MLFFHAKQVGWRIKSLQVITAFISRNRGCRSPQSGAYYISKSRQLGRFSPSSGSLGKMCLRNFVTQSKVDVFVLVSPPLVDWVFLVESALISHRAYPSCIFRSKHYKSQSIKRQVTRYYTPQPGMTTHLFKGGISPPPLPFVGEAPFSMESSAGFEKLCLSIRLTRYSFQQWPRQRRSIAPPPRSTEAKGVKGYLKRLAQYAKFRNTSLEMVWKVQSQADCIKTIFHLELIRNKEEQVKHISREEFCVIQNIEFSFYNTNPSSSINQPSPCPASRASSSSMEFERGLTWRQLRLAFSQSQTRAQPFISRVFPGSLRIDLTESGKKVYRVFQKIDFVEQELSGHEKTCCTLGQQGSLRRPSVTRNNWASLLALSVHMKSLQTLICQNILFTLFFGEIATVIRALLELNKFVLDPSFDTYLRIVLPQVLAEGTLNFGGNKNLRKSSEIHYRRAPMRQKEQVVQTLILGSGFDLGRCP